ncbi:MAG: hypothetical protein R3C49_06450 [Planctomycetaceae bacterium]
MLLAMVFAACVGLLPLLWVLRDVGGYSAVRQNHAGYFLGFVGWKDHLVDHLIYRLASTAGSGAVSLVMGLLAAGTRRHGSI